ncbi:PAS domain-containing protein [Streptomyces winkii]|uniref:PAS domain-containing protein n=1 Tax=Streptomyces winkii TaxID=3051178 RepID=UPI0028D68A17|nr:PAS domain-containing protein [Streptomyces sp. DSM 40971]
MTDVEGFGAELADFRRRVEELRAARSLPEEEHQPSLDAALFELRHVAEVLWPRYEELAAAGRRSGSRDEGHEQQLLRAVFQGLPVPVVLLDRDAVVRRLNSAAAQLFGVRAGYAAGRSLTGSLTHDGRPLFRTQVAATARGEGARSLRVHLLHPAAPGPGETAHTTLRVTLTGLHTPQDARSAVLGVFQPVVEGQEGPAPAEVTPLDARTAPVPDLDEVSQLTGLLDLVDDVAAGLLAEDGPPERVAERAASVLRERFADWVIVDVGGKDALARAVVLGPDEALRAALAEQDPFSAPVVVEAVEQGTSTLQARTEDSGAFGWDGTGSAVLVRAEAGSLVCAPLPESQGVLTLFRRRSGRAFQLAEASAVERMARHIALALRRARNGEEVPDGR